MTKLAVFGCAAALLLSACGGDSAENLFEAAAGAAGTDIDSVEVTDDGFAANVGSAEVVFGGGNERPDWLEPEFLWPEGFEAQYAINDPSTGERAYVGSVPGADGSALQAEQYGRLIAAGYERLGDSTVFVHPGRPPVDVEIGGDGSTVYISVSHRFEDERTLRDAYAPVEGDGTMAVRLGDENYLFEGSCSLRSSSGQFETRSDDLTAGRGSISVDVRDGEQDYILANVATLTENNSNQWTMLQVDDAGNYPTITLDERGFTVEGFMASFVDGSTKAVAIDVSCPA